MVLQWQGPSSLTQVAFPQGQHNWLDHSRRNLIQIPFQAP